MLISLARQTLYRRQSELSQLSSSIKHYQSLATEYKAQVERHRAEQEALSKELSLTHNIIGLITSKQIPGHRDTSLVYEFDQTLSHFLV